MKNYGLKEITDLLQKGNLAQVEVLMRVLLQREPANAAAFHFLGLVASAVNQPQFAIQYFTEASRLAPHWQDPVKNLEVLKQQLTAYDQVNPVGAEHMTGGKDTTLPSKNEKYLLIKAWGSGFWSDVSHVLGQLLVAEITGRVPVVHWGSNSLFSDGTGSNAFEFYFEPLSNVCIDVLQRDDFDFWPPKWNYHNLKEGELNKWAGPFSRVAGLYLLSRPEKVVVSDFHAPVIDMQPWIPSTHHLYGLSIDQLCRYLVWRYLRPKSEILEKVDRFYKNHLASTDFISVHARGSDKIVEMNNLDQMNLQYKETIDRCLAASKSQYIFLMTDDSRLLEYFSGLYGDKIITTDCQRTNSVQGIHYQAVPDRRRLGEEIMVDAYLAARGKAFVGNGSSNPSAIMKYLRDWSDEDVYLIGQNMYHSYNLLPHDW